MSFVNLVGFQRQGIGKVFEQRLISYRKFIRQRAQSRRLEPPARESRTFPQCFVHSVHMLAYLGSHHLLIINPSRTCPTELAHVHVIGGNGQAPFFCVSNF